MFVDITNTALPKPILYLCKPNRDIIFNLTEAYEVNFLPKFGQISELTFSVPYDVDIDHTLVANPYVEMIKHRYLIKFILDTYTEWFVVDIPNKKSDESSDINSITCYSLGYELNDKLIRIFNTEDNDGLPLNATQSLVEILDGSIWNVGHVSAVFDLMYRSFDVTSSTALNMVFEIANTFGAVVKWDTENRTVSLYEVDELGLKQDLIFNRGKYLESLSYTIDPDTFCTRLYVTGKDDAVINSVNPSGAAYIENFTYFIDKFERDESKVVLTHSDYMTDGLCNALLDYQDLLVIHEDSFSTLLSQLTTLQADVLVKYSDLSSLNEELTEIKDELQQAQFTGGTTYQLLQDEADKEAEIAIKQTEIDSINNSIDNVNTDISALQEIINIENNFTASQIIELNQFIIEKELKNEYISDPEQLLVWAKKQMLKLIEPQVKVEIDVVNFLQCLDPECVTDRTKLTLSGGDTVRIVDDKFNINIEAKIIEMDINFDDESIKLTISNESEIKSDKEKFLEKINSGMSASTEISFNKFKWNAIDATANDVSLLLNNAWDAAAREINAGVNKCVLINGQGISITDSNDSLKLIRLTNSVLGCSQDGGNSYKTAISSEGVFAERLVGEILIGENLVIDASTSEGTQIMTVNENGCILNGMTLSITGGLNGVSIDSTDGLIVTRTDKKTRTILNATEGIKIQKSTDGGLNYTDVFYADENGDIGFTGNMVGGTISIGSGNSIFKADGSGIYLGNDNYASAPFHVSTLGELYANNANIQGVIDCTDLQINGESILSITGDMISDTFINLTKAKVDGLGISIVDTTHPTNKLYLQRKMLGTPPIDHGVEVLVTDSVHSYSMYTDDNDSVLLHPIFGLAFDNTPFIKRDLTDDITYATGTWSFADTIINAGSYFESTSVVYSGSNFDFRFENQNKYKAFPIYLVQADASCSAIKEGDYYNGIHVEPVNATSGDRYSIIAFCRETEPTP